MKFEIDEEAGEIRLEREGASRVVPLYSDEGFEIIADVYTKVGWNQRHSYTFTWFGRPIVQLPDDMIRIQELIYDLKPDWIVETGVAHGGSLVFYSSLCRALGSGRVIGIDIEIRPHNRKAIEEHDLFDRITLIEGGSTAPEVLAEVRGHIRPGESVLVILDSNHSYAHVAEELRLYSDLVTVGSYIVATDGIMKDLHDVPRGAPEWEHDNPATAAKDFARAHPSFRLGAPDWPFNESTLSRPVTYWPSAYLKRIQ